MMGLHFNEIDLDGVKKVGARYGKNPVGYSIRTEKKPAWKKGAVIMPAMVLKAISVAMDNSPYYTALDECYDSLSTDNPIAMPDEETAKERRARLYPNAKDDLDRTEI